MTERSRKTQSIKSIKPTGVPLSPEISDNEYLISKGVKGRSKQSILEVTSGDKKPLYSPDQNNDVAIGSSFEFFRGLVEANLDRLPQTAREKFWTDIEQLYYNPYMEKIEQIEKLLSDWNSSSIDNLINDLQNGILKNHYATAAEEPSSIQEGPTVLASGWVATQSLPPDVATAIRTAGAIRQRKHRSKMSDAEKAEERAKNAARMRAKRSRPPQP